MNDLDDFRDNPQAAVAFATHRALHPADRSLVDDVRDERPRQPFPRIGVGRLGGTGLCRPDVANRLYTFGLALFPVLCFLGLATFHRALQASIDDTLYLQRINRLRRFYLEATPILAGYLARPAATDDVEDVLRREAFRPGWWQLMVSVPGAISVINSALVGVTVGLAAGAVTGDNLWVATIAGVVVFAVAIPAHLRYQHRVRAAATLDPFGELGPAAG